MTSDERIAWLKERQRGIGSSDAPCLVGLGFQNAAQIYASKTEPVSDKPAQGNLRRGLELEPLVAQMYEEMMGVPVLRVEGNLPVCRIVRNEFRPWQTCTPDGYRQDDHTPVQFKTTAGFGDDWGPTGSDQVPAYIRVERQHEMGVLGVEQMDLIALDVIMWEPRVYRLEFDREFFGWLSGVEAHFWNLVQNRQPLPPDWEENHAPAIAKLTDDGTPDLGDEIAALVERRKELTRIGDEAQVEAGRLKAQIEEAMGDNAKATAGPWKLKRSVIEACSYTANRKAYVRLDIRAIREKVRA